MDNDLVKIAELRKRITEKEILKTLRNMNIGMIFIIKPPYREVEKL